MSLPSNPHRILVVDDNADQRDAIVWFLELEGAHVTVAGDGEEALNVLRADPLRVSFSSTSTCP